MKDRTPHLCRNALGTAICASNGIGPAQYADRQRRIEHCIICGRWWKIHAVTPHLTIWAEVPAWMIWLSWHRIWKTDHKSSTEREGEQMSENTSSQTTQPNPQHQRKLEQALATIHNHKETK